MQAVHRLHAHVHGREDGQAVGRGRAADGRAGQQLRVPVFVRRGGLQLAVRQRHQHLVHRQQPHRPAEQVSKLRRLSAVLRHGEWVPATVFAERQSIPQNTRG